MEFNITKESERLHAAIDKCLYKPEHSVKRWEVKIKTEKQEDGKYKDFIVYKAEFTYGPFNNFFVIAQKKYFRVLEDEELVKMVFRALSKHRACFDFSFKRAKFVKRVMCVG